MYRVTGPGQYQPDRADRHDEDFRELHPSDDHGLVALIRELAR